MAGRYVVTHLKRVGQREGGEPITIRAGKVEGAQAHEEYFMRTDLDGVMYCGRGGTPFAAALEFELLMWSRLGRGHSGREDR